MDSEKKNKESHNDSQRSLTELSIIDQDDEENDYEYNQHGLSGAILVKENHHLTLSKKAVLGTFEASMKKATKKYFHTFCEGILGGFFISLAYIAAIFSTIGIESAGMKLVVMGLVFTIAILLITFVGGCLYTSNCLGFLNVYVKNVKKKPFVTNLFVAYGGNFVGTFVAILILVLMGLVIPMYNDSTIDHGAFSQAMNSVYMKKIWTIGYTLQGNMANADQYAAIVNAIGQTKADELLRGNVDVGMFFYVFFANLASGIICNILIASTLYITYSTKNAAAIAIVLMFDILAFVIGGFQHSVANAFLFWADLFQSTATGFNTYDLGNIDSSLAGNLVAINPATSGYFIASNLVPAFIGNFIGGGIFLPFVLYGVFKDDIKKLSAELLAKKAKEQAMNVVDNIKAEIK